MVNPRRRQTPPSFVGDPDKFYTHQSIIRALWGKTENNEKDINDAEEEVDETEKAVFKIKPRKKLLPPEEESTKTQIFFTIIIHGSLLIYTLIIFFGELFLLPSNEIEWCNAAQNGYVSTKYYHNIDFNNNPCFRERTVWLLGLNQQECDFARRMVVSVFLGAVIGLERKASDRPAGIRTMGLVCLGTCFFSMCGQIAFRSSTMGWDAARVSAAVPSGVGFLGAGLIWKGSVGEKGTDDERPEVHGLTTAASVWLSAAVGVGVGGRLFVVSFYAVVLVVMVLRLGPRMYFSDDSSSYEDSDDEDLDEWESGNDISSEDDDEPGDNVSDGYSREEKLQLLMGIKKEEEGQDDQQLQQQQQMEEKEYLKDRIERFRSAPNLFKLETLPSSEGGKVESEEFIPLVDHSSDAYRHRDEGRGRRRRVTHRRSTRGRQHRSHSPKHARHVGLSFHS